MTAYEINFDGLVGPTHNYAGLAWGNVASSLNAGTVSRPKQAALQGIGKMRLMLRLGLKQGVLPPHMRPHFPLLRAAGFEGGDEEIISAAAQQAPSLLANAYSASYMWAANAATVSPSVDTADGKVHFTPANLASKLHRSIEPAATARTLKMIFADPQYFAHHPPLPSTEYFADEGAANHTRLAASHAAPGVEFFVYGKRGEDAGKCSPRKFAARQSYEACAAVARAHKLSPGTVVFAQQNPEAIDAGVFHNDVIAVGNGNVLFYHEQAWVDSNRVVADIAQKFSGTLHTICVRAGEVSADDAVKSYLFNSQIVTLPDGAMAIIAPKECEENSRVHARLQQLLTANTPIRAVHYLDVRESMKNGGGPACLRLRVALTEKELAHVHPAVLLDEKKCDILEQWVKKHYRDELHPKDLADPSLIREARNALTELAEILQLPELYGF